MPDKVTIPITMSKDTLERMGKAVGHNPNMSIEDIIIKLLEVVEGDLSGFTDDEIFEERYTRIVYSDS